MEAIYKLLGPGAVAILNICQQVGEEFRLAILKESWMIRVLALSLCTPSIRQSLLGQIDLLDGPHFFLHLAHMTHAHEGDEDGGKLWPHIFAGHCLSNVMSH